MRVASALAAWIRAGLARRFLPWAVAALAVLLSTPSLRVGLQADDYILRMGLTRPPPSPEWARSPWRAFVFDETNVREAIDSGALPWWTSPDLKVAFFRPLAGLTHWLDFRLWPGRPWLMHAHSLLWFGAAVAAAAALYRRLLLPLWSAGLAGLVFALDDAHGLPASWIANRNALIGTLFALLAVLAHDRWRRDGWRPGAVLAPVSLLLGLLGGEIALAGGAYLLAHALFLDDGTPRQRLASLLPAGLAGAAWAVAYRALGFGVRGCGVYLDPIASPREFLDAVVERGPLLLGGQWALPAQVGVMLSPRAARWWWLAACGLALLLSALLAPLLRRDRAARFLALGMVLSLLPACASLPQDRLLLLAGFGGAGLLAQLLAGLADGAGWLPRSRPWRAFASVGGAALAVLHLVLAPVGLTRAAGQVRLVGRVVGRSAESLPSGPDARERSAVIVQTPTAINCFFAAAILAATRGSPPALILVLSPGLEETTLERTGEETLLVRPAGGYFLPPGTRAPGVPPRDIDPRYALPLLDRLFRDDRAWRQGERRDLPGVAVTVTRLTADGRPAEVEFRFAGGLTRPSLVWLRWESWAYVPFEPPPPGTSVTLPSPTARSSKAGVRRRQALAKGSPGVPAVGESSQATKHP